MKKFHKILTTTLLSATMVTSSIQAPIAAPIHIIQSQTELNRDANIVKVRHRYHRKGRHFHRHPLRHPRRYNRQHRHSSPWPYIIGGIIIGDAIVNANRHHSWCSNRFRSYDRRSNSYQPYHGSRKQCRSPNFH